MVADKKVRHLVFGTGPLGLAVMQELFGRGRAVTLVNRSGKVEERVPNRVQVLQGDATDAEQVAAVCADAAVVFHCAQPGYANWPEQFPPITRGILEGVARTEAKLIFGDNLYAYGPTHGQPLHEELPYAATGPKGRTRAEMARMLLEAGRAGRIKVAIGRASDFYGPRVRGSVVGDVVFEAALKGRTVNVLGNPDLPHTYTYIHDFARGLVTLSERDEALGQVWHVPSAETVTTRRFVEMIGEEVGHPLKIRAGGRIMVALLGLFVSEVREMREMLYEFEEPFVVDHGKFERVFGVQPTPHPVAIRETLAWYREHTEV